MIDAELIMLMLALFAILFISYRWIFQKLLPAGISRSILIWVMALLSTPIALLGLILLLFTINAKPQREFDRAIWDSQPDSRIEMSSAIEAIKLRGLTKAEVDSLLGSPTEKKEREWIYVLGPSPSFISPDLRVLIIRFEGDSVISSIVRDT